VGEGSTPASVFDELCRRQPGLGPMRSMLRCAVDQEYAAWDQVLRDGAELALIPPTAGG
jgi:MoaE-MoaD fusion protein